MGLPGIQPFPMDSMYFYQMSGGCLSAKGHRPEPERSIRGAVPHAVLFIILILFIPPSLAATEKCIIGIPPEKNIFTQSERYEPLQRYLQDELQFEVQFQVLPSYEAIITKLLRGELDGAFLSSLIGAAAIHVLHFHPIARPVIADGLATYHGIIAFRSETPISGPEDMAGKKLALVNRATMAGYLFPLVYFRRIGISDWNEHFSKIFFTGSHDAAIEAVVSGMADIGAFKSSVFQSYQRDFPDKAKQLHILVRSPEVPSNALFMKKDCDTKLRDQLRGLLLMAHTHPRGSAVLEEIGALRFVSTKSAEYDPVVELAREADIALGEFLSPEK